jgi:hypothetical protein
MLTDTGCPAGDSQVKDPAFDRVSQSYDIDCDAGPNIMFIESGRAVRLACDGKYCKRPVRVQQAGATP